MYKSMKQLKEATASTGSLWFTKKSLEFFGTKIERKIYGGKYFITSDFQIPGGPRGYNVRICVDGKVRLIDFFCQHKTKQDAEKAIAQLLK